MTGETAGSKSRPASLRWKRGLDVMPPRRAHPPEPVTDVESAAAGGQRDLPTLLVA
jgi:hypothetical protein